MAGSLTGVGSGGEGAHSQVRQSSEQMDTKGAETGEGGWGETGVGIRMALGGGHLKCSGKSL